MLLPDKHVRLAESTIGLGAFILEQLGRARTIDQIYQRMQTARQTGHFYAYHDFDSLLLALTFLYTVGAVRADLNGKIYRCD